MAGGAKSVEVSNARSARVAGGCLAGLALLSVVLVTQHPASGASGLENHLRAEAAAQVGNLVVHGGFILILSANLICYAMLARNLGFASARVLAALILIAIGTGFLSQSMLVEGLVVPSLAAHFVAGPSADLPQASPLILFCATLVKILMPLGLLFQAAGGVAWASQLLCRPGPAHKVGAVGILMNLGSIAALAVGWSTDQPVFLMIPFALQIAWNFVGGLLFALSAVAGAPLTGNRSDHLNESVLAAAAPL